MAPEECNYPVGEEKCRLLITMDEVGEAITGILDQATLAGVCAHAVSPLKSVTYGSII